MLIGKNIHPDICTNIYFTSNTHVYIIYTKSCQTINDVTGAFNREILKLAIYKIDPK